MFTSKLDLIEGMGVDPEIAAFFVDRAVPMNNTYWEGRYLYVARGTGFLFIPLFFDLQLKAGISREHLLDEDYVQLMESIMDLAGKYEKEELGFQSHIAQIESLVNARSVQPALFQKLNTYFSNYPHFPIDNIGTDNPALNRGDAFLYLLTVLPYEEKVINTIIGYWYLLVPSFLLMDDVMDLHEDQDKAEENALSVFGYDAAGVRQALVLLDQNFAELAPVNPLLADHFRRLLEFKKESTYFKYLLKE